MKTQVVKVYKHTAKFWAECLTSPEELPAYKSGQTIDTISVGFGDGIEVDIKLVNGDSPYVDAVIFNEGCELACLDAYDELVGEYIFDTPKGKFTVIVEEK